ncbi:MAG: hypothetical protein HYV59_05660 [Planctomycetes bacterium]|nr:hypothetical protein [Planctomycetota bacterium]
MIGTCQLCRKSKILRESHIIPNFVFKWLKDTSATGYLRPGSNPNKRSQDGVKQYLLCDDCEQLFGNWENKFKNSIFLPLSHGKANKFSYSSWLLKFAVSISWRVLASCFKQDLSRFSTIHLDKANKALEVWREFLLDKRPHPDKYQQHILPMDLIENHNDPNMPTNINSYILRSVDMDVVWFKKRAFVYSKMCRVIILGFIDEDRPNYWEGTKIHVHKGIVGETLRYRIPENFIAYLKDRTNKVRSSLEGISEKQWDRIEQTYSKDMDRAMASETLKATYQDVKMFGDKAFVKNNSKKK